MNTVERVNISFFNMRPADTGQRLWLRHCLCRARYINAPLQGKEWSYPPQFFIAKGWGFDKPSDFRIS
jgi:hypothetical protein